MRNQIDIAILIADILEIEHRFNEGGFQFLCPLCNEFNTAVNPETNLARCFRCKKNFNPIDITIINKRCRFITAVNFLHPLLGMKGK